MIPFKDSYQFWGAKAYQNFWCIILCRRQHSSDSCICGCLQKSVFGNNVETCCHYDSCSSKLFFLQLVHCIIALLAAIFFLWVSTTFTGKDLLRKHSPNIESLVSCPLYRQTEGFFCGDHVAMRYVVATKPGTKLGMNFLVRGNLLLKIGWFLVVANTNYMHESCRYYTSQQGMCKSSQTKSVIISSAQRIQLQLSSDLWLSDGGQKGQHGGSWKLGSASRYRFRGAMVCKTVFGIIMW